MKKQVIRIAALALFVTTFAIASAHAQNAGNNLRVTIPFDFVIGGEKLPAGDYLVHTEDSRTTMNIQSRDQSSQAYFLVHPVPGVDIKNKSKLIFRKYEGEYSLSQVWVEGRASGQELNKTSRERTLQRDIAKRSGKPEFVSIAARSN
jgi:hypothetical protein